MKHLIGSMLIVIGLIAPAACTVKRVQFKQECEGYLKQTADASTAALALERLNHAIEYTEANQLTKGYTSVLWTTEDENIGFFYQNLKMCQSELEACLISSQLEQTNVLMKVRESLMDGTEMTIPIGLSLYPNNLIWGILSCLSIFLIITGVVLINQKLSDI